MSEYTIEDEYKRFPKSISPKMWYYYLGRKLSMGEMKLFRDVKYELHMNQMLHGLHEMSHSKNLYVSALTGLYGNCMFESLNYHKIGEDVMSLRQTLSYFLYQYQDFPNIFPTQSETLKDIFTMGNEIEHVICDKNEKYYKYTYNVMCQDLASDHSWTKIPTQLILMVISLLFEVEIIIISNLSDWENKINVWGKDKKVNTIWIGHLGEHHYLPLDKIKDDQLDKNIEILMYRNAMQFFIKWKNFQVKEMYEKNKMMYEHKKMAEERKRKYSALFNHRRNGNMFSVLQDTSSNESDDLAGEFHDVAGEFVDYRSHI
jgi:hypothetical protein